MSLSERAGDGGRAIAPLYKRLPRGPHRLEPKEVIHHQRIRMHGAMVEAVALYGYERTSVKRVIALAGVSRRAFYEQFTNKQDCFLATFDLLATRTIRRVCHAYRSTDGAAEDRLRAAFKAFAEEVEANPKGAHLVLLDAPTAGPEGVLRLCRVTATFEHMLSSSFMHAPGMSPLPIPVIRGIVGGIRQATSMRLHDGRTAELPGLAEEMLRWALLFHTPAVNDLDTYVRLESQAAHIPRQLSARASTNTQALARVLAVAPHAAAQSAPEPSCNSSLGVRARLLRCALELAVREDYEDLSAIRIADEAHVPVEAFLELFANKDECYLAAFDMLSSELLELVVDPDLVSSEWPSAVRRAVSALMCHLAANPVYAQTIATHVYAAGPCAIERNVELAHDIATLLTEGAPRKAHSTIALEATAGAIWHTILSQTANCQVHLLPTLADYLSYVVLAPFIGAKAAATVLIEGQSNSSGSLTSPRAHATEPVVTG
jgi:AcrR family transcriptional regulator